MVLPFILWLFRIIRAISPTEIMNSKSETQHPCLTPFLGKKYGDVKPALTIHVSGSLNSILTESQNDSEGRGAGVSCKVYDVLDRPNIFSNVSPSQEAILICMCNI